jgi:hypothetical protein
VVDTCIYLRTMLGDRLLGPEAMAEVFTPTGGGLAVTAAVTPYTGPAPTRSMMEQASALGLFVLLSAAQAPERQGLRVEDQTRVILTPGVAGLGPVAVDLAQPGEMLARDYPSFSWHLQVARESPGRILCLYVRGISPEDCLAFLYVIRSLDDARVARDQLIHICDYRGSAATTQLILRAYPNTYFGYHLSAMNFGALSWEGLRMMPPERILLGTGSQVGNVADNLWLVAQVVGRLREEDPAALLYRASRNALRLYRDRRGPYPP